MEINNNFLVRLNNWKFNKLAIDPIHSDRICIALVGKYK